MCKDDYIEALFFKYYKYCNFNNNFLILQLNFCYILIKKTKLGKKNQ